MEQFTDANGCRVRLSFEPDVFEQAPMHVLVFPHYQGAWVLTKHSTRGLEFPGGKIEKGESPRQAAIREVFEETGANVLTLTPIADYEVSNEQVSFVKRVFFAEVSGLQKKTDYLETEGPVLIKDLTLANRHHSTYSFIMQDEVVTKCLRSIAAKHGTS